MQKHHLETCLAVRELVDIATNKRTQYSCGGGKYTPENVESYLQQDIVQQIIARFDNPQFESDVRKTVAAAQILQYAIEQYREAIERLRQWNDCSKERE